MAVNIEDILETLRDLTDPESCWLDHSGHCQEHNWFNDDRECPNFRAKMILLEI